MPGFAGVAAARPVMLVVMGARFVVVLVDVAVNSVKLGGETVGAVARDHCVVEFDTDCWSLWSC